MSDELGLMAHGLETLERTRIRDDLDRLAGIARELRATMILLGDPLQLSGERGVQAEKVREFGGRLSRRTGLPVEFWDERYTSVEAERVLRDSGAGTRQRIRNVDRLAAVIILNSYLGWRACQREAGARPE